MNGLKKGILGRERLSWVTWMTWTLLGSSCLEHRIGGQGKSWEGRDETGVGSSRRQRALHAVLEDQDIVPEAWRWGVKRAWEDVNCHMPIRFDI